MRRRGAIPVSGVLLLIGAAFALPSRAAGGACPTPMFREVTDAAGIRFLHHKPVFDPKLEKIMPWMSSINAGIAVADYDGDGLPDIYLLNSQQKFPNALFRNLGDFRFAEVGRKAGLANVNDEAGVSMDAYFADVDNNGTEDLVLAQYGRTRLFLNQGGSFSEAGQGAGFSPVGNAAAVAVFDYDRDGWLDILIGNYYADFDLWHLTTTKILQTDFQNARNGGRKLLYHNNRNGTFTEVSKQAGITDTGWTLDIGTGDLQNQGLMDIYLANDFGTDVVYRNNGDGTFTDVTLEATGGDKFGGMNAEIADYNDDGWLDVYVTNITDEFLQQGNLLLQNQGSLVFSNVGQDTGTADGGWGWGGKFFDYDNDGRLDLFTVNGFVSDGPLDIFRFPGVLNSADVSDASLWPDMRGVSMSGYEKKRLFHNEGNRFREMAQSAGFTSLLDGRGVAIADFDGDGALDVAVSNCGATPLLYRNETSAPEPWLEVELRGTAGNRDAIGARVTLVAGGRSQMREVDGGNGFSAQSWRVLHFGLGTSQSADELQVRWPNGRRQVFKDVPLRSRLLIVEPAP